MLSFMYSFFLYIFLSFFLLVLVILNIKKCYIGDKQKFMIYIYIYFVSVNAYFISSTENVLFIYLSFFFSYIVGRL